MPVMNVVITMADENSAENKHLLDYLHANVAEFKRHLQMKIETAPKGQKGLPMAQIGAKPPVVGWKAIVAALSNSYTMASTIVGRDEVEAFQEAGIMRGMEEDKSRPIGGADPDALAQKFTQAVASRPRGGPPNGRAPPNAMRLKPATEHSAPSRPLVKGGPKQLAAKASGDTPDSALAAGFKQVDDGLENDPHMKQFWANMQETPM